jgi:chromosome segregation ATPase
MTETTIAHIISNYKEQIEMYSHMLELAQQQLDLVENNAPADEILAERYRLMDDISSLNKQNQEWQDSVCQSMEIKSFTISNLQSTVNPAVIEELSQVLKEISQVLQQIEEVDQKIQAILNQQLIPRNRPRASHKRAKKAYQKGKESPS